MPYECSEGNEEGVYLDDHIGYRSLRIQDRVDKRGYELIPSKPGRAVYIFPARVDTDVGNVFDSVYIRFQKDVEKVKDVGTVRLIIKYCKKGVFVTENALLCNVL